MDKESTPKDPEQLKTDIINLYHTLQEKIDLGDSYSIDMMNRLKNPKTEAYKILKEAGLIE